jgi:hypothetical protein
MMSLMNMYCRIFLSWQTNKGKHGKGLHKFVTSLNMTEKGELENEVKIMLVGVMLDIFYSRIK